MNGTYKQGWNEERKLLLKLVTVYEQVQYIQKRGHNKFHNYKYATEADVNEKVREEIAKLKIIMMPSIINKEMRVTTTKSGNTEYIYRVDMDFVFMDAETGESLTVQMSGEGQDVGDKAIFKAISGCQKYALMKAFMIPTGDDPEGDDDADKRNAGIGALGTQQSNQNNQTSNNTSRETQATTSHSTASTVKLASEAQVKMIRAKMSAAGFKDVGPINSFLALSLTSITELPMAKVNELIKFLDEQRIPA